MKIAELVGVLASVAVAAGFVIQLLLYRRKFKKLEAFEKQCSHTVYRHDEKYGWQTETPWGWVCVVPPLMVAVPDIDPDSVPPIPKCKPPKEDRPTEGIDRLEAFLEEHGDRFKAFSVLNVQPGDTIVLSHPGVISTEAINNTREHATAYFSPETKLVILEEGMEVKGVLRRNYAVEEKVMCTKCGERPGNHSGGTVDNGTNLCCQCHVAGGGSPADWHPGCMEAYAAKKSGEKVESVCGECGNRTMLSYAKGVSSQFCKVEGCRGTVEPAKLA